MSYTWLLKELKVIFFVCTMYMIPTCVHVYFICILYVVSDLHVHLSFL